MHVRHGSAAVPPRHARTASLYSPSTSAQPFAPPRAPAAATSAADGGRPTSVTVLLSSLNLNLAAYSMASLITTARHVGQVGEVWEGVGMCGRCGRCEGLDKVDRT